MLLLLSDCSKLLVFLVLVSKGLGGNTIPECGQVASKSSRVVQERLVGWPQGMCVSFFLSEVWRPQSYPQGVC